MTDAPADEVTVRPSKLVFEGLVQGSSRCIFRARPRSEFYPRRLVIDLAEHDEFWVRGISVALFQQLVAPLPAKLFAPLAIPVDLDLPRVPVDREVELDVFNKRTKPAMFSAHLYGYVWERT